MSDIDTYGNGPALKALSTLEALNVNVNFLSNLKGGYFSCAYFSDNTDERRLRQKIEKSSDGLFRYHNRVVIPRKTNNLAFFILRQYWSP